MPGRNLFAFGRGPSAETLAGSGPTATYPVPPSANATPEAIASVAGGTAPSIDVANGPVTKPAPTQQIADIDISPGYATPASSVGQTNMAAAQANGIYTSPGNQTSSADTVATASGYTYGSKALTPKSEAIGTPPSAYATNGGYGASMNELKTPSTSFAPPEELNTNPGSAIAAAPATIATTVATANQADSSATTTPSDAENPSTEGYTLPTDSPAMAGLAPPKSPVKASASEEPNHAFAPPAASAPDFSTASTAGAAGAGGESAITSPLKASSGSSGYMPGSTSTDHGYPTGEIESTEDGSFYR